MNLVLWSGIVFIYAWTRRVALSYCMNSKFGIKPWYLSLSISTEPKYRASGLSIGSWQLYTRSFLSKATLIIQQKHKSELLGATSVFCKLWNRHVDHFSVALDPTSGDLTLRLVYFVLGAWICRRWQWQKFTRLDVPVRDARTHEREHAVHPIHGTNQTKCPRASLFKQGRTNEYRHIILSKKTVWVTPCVKVH